MKIIGIIPARYESTRLLGKPLIEIKNKPIIQMTYEAALNSKLFDFVFIATDSTKIKASASKFNASCIMTESQYQNGTERCAAAIEKINRKINDDDIIINIQCDEPFIQKSHLQKMINVFQKDIQISTIISPIQHMEITDKSIVKLNIRKDNTAIGFSRYHNKLTTPNKIYKHIGVYGYRKKILLKISQLKPTKHELNESLEQLRWIENNYKIHCAIIKDNIISINTKNDIKKL